MLHRKSYSVGEMENILFEYHKRFEEYINRLIDLIMPDGYLNNKIGVDEAINNVLRMVEIKENRDKNFQSYGLAIIYIGGYICYINSILAQFAEQRKSSKPAQKNTIINSLPCTNVTDAMPGFKPTTPT